MRDFLAKALEGFDVDVNIDMLDNLILYYKELTSWNEKTNLTAITDFEDAVYKHFADSLAVCNIIDIKNIKNISDIGTGAGFPGLVLKIAYPHLHLLLLDSNNKKIAFLEHMVSKLKLADVCIVHDRSEIAARDERYRQKYDICVSRAVAAMPVLCEYCLPFVKVGGIFAAYKSKKTEEEVCKAKNAIQILGGELQDVHSLNIKDMERNIVIIKKIKSTPKKYPRKCGVPKKQPLM